MEKKEEELRNEWAVMCCVLQSCKRMHVMQKKKKKNVKKENGT